MSDTTIRQAKTLTCKELCNFLLAHKELMPSATTDDLQRVVCIWRDVSSPIVNADAIFLFPTGQIVAIISCFSISSVISLANSLISGGSHILDDIARIYYSETKSQAYLISDLMVAHGFMSFEDKQQLYSSVDNKLRSGDFLFIILDDVSNEQIASFRAVLNDRSIKFNVAFISR